MFRFRPNPRALVLPLILLLVLTVLLAPPLFLTGCRTSGLAPGAHPAPRNIDPNAPLLHHKWWNYYLRGQARMLAGDYTGARDDFEHCIGIKKGAVRINDRDRWQVRTYGTHRLENYFPNRELAICLFQLGDRAAAKPLLEKSLRQTKSSRANFFLKECHRQEVAALPPTLPASKPVISLPQATTEKVIVTKRDILPLRTVTRAQRRVDTLRITPRGYPSQPVWIEAAESTVDHIEPVPLSPGPNVIEIAARDLAGQETRESVQVIADWTTPRLSVASVDETPGAIQVTAKVTDNDQLASLSLNDRPLTGGAGMDRSAPSEESFTLSLPRSGPALLRALDRAGNVLAIDLLASLSAADPPDAPKPPGFPGRSGDRVKPVFELKNIRAILHTSASRFYLDGKVRDKGGLDSLTINGEEWLEENGAKLATFGGMLPLEEGPNPFTIIARDKAGNVAELAFTVNRSNAQLAGKHRLRACLTPFVSPASPDDTDPTIPRLRRDFEGCLVEGSFPVPARFRLLARAQEEWDAILLEQRISLSDLSKKEALIGLGLVTPADLLFNGVAETHREGHTIRLRSIDTATGTVIGIDDVYVPAEDPGEAVMGLADKVERRFPLLSAPVDTVKGNSVTVPIGREDGLVEWSSFLLFPDETFAHPRTQKEAPLRLRLDTLGDHSSTLTIVGRGDHDPMQETDHVHTR